MCNVIVIFKMLIKSEMQITFLLSAPQLLTKSLNISEHLFYIIKYRALISALYFSLLTLIFSVSPTNTKRLTLSLTSYITTILKIKLIYNFYNPLIFFIFLLNILVLLVDVVTKINNY